MKIIYPTEKFCKEFVSEYITPWLSRASGYRTKKKMLFIFDDLKVPDFYDEQQRFEIYSLRGKTYLEVSKSSFWNGSDNSQDWDSRLMASLIHDYFIFATRQTKNYVYRDAGDSVFGSVIKAQKGMWINYYFASKAVKKFTKIQKKRNFY